jgi:hypothetical protein
MSEDLPSSGSLATFITFFGIVQQKLYFHKIIIFSKDPDPVDLASRIRIIYNNCPAPHQ